MKKILFRLLIGVVGILIVAVVWFLVRTRIPPEEVAQLASTQGDRVLRDPMRPKGSGPRVLLIALDGVGYDELRLAIDEGRLPHLSSVLGRRQGDDYAHGILSHAISILPSTTMAAWSSIFSGAPPAQTGVPGNEWFVRENMQFFAPAPVSVDDLTHTVRMLTDGLVGNAIRVPTLFERLDRRAFVALAPVYRGADLFVTPQPEAVGGMFLATMNGIVGSKTVPREVYSEVDEETVENMVEGVEEYGLPDLQVVYFPGIDLYTHVASPPLKEERDYLRDVTDPAIGEILAVYRKAGVLDSTYVVVLSDHGHTPVFEDDRHALGIGDRDEPTAVLEQIGFRVRPPSIELGREASDFQAVVAYQGAMAYIYLADRSTCPKLGTPCDWKRPPRFEEDVLPVARAFYEASTEGRRVPALKGTLDLVFTRLPRPTGTDALPFQVLDGKRLQSIADYLQTNPRPDLLQLDTRMAGLSAGPYGHRAGDVLLLAHSAMERPVDQRFYFSSEYRSWHGSPSAQDSHVPLLVAHPQHTAAQLRGKLRAFLTSDLSQLQFTDIILHLMSR